MKKFFDYPLAVYVATFANGETARLSVGARKGKVDCERARRMIAHMWRDWQRAELTEGPRIYPHQFGPMPAINTDSIAARLDRYYSMPDRTDIVAGHVEHDGKIIADPFFAPATNVVAMPKRRKATASDPIDSILVALDKLSLDDMLTIGELISEMVDEKLAA